MPEKTTAENIGINISELKNNNRESFNHFLNKHPDRVFRKKELMNYFNISSASFKDWIRYYKFHTFVYRHQWLYGCKKAVDAAKKKLNIT